MCDTSSSHASYSEPAAELRGTTEPSAPLCATLSYSPSLSLSSPSSPSSLSSPSSPCQA